MMDDSLDMILKKYSHDNKEVFKEIQSICHAYKPRFVKKFLHDKEKANNIDISDQSSIKKSLEDIIDGSENI